MAQQIVHLVPGAGGMYCGSCMHGNTLCAALVAAGVDATLVPLYTPLRTDEENVGVDRVAMGGIQLYLQDRSPLFRHVPWPISRWLDHPGLLRWASRRPTTVRPETLGRLTVSMLQGEQGRQRRELNRLVEWLRRDVRPSVVHLGNVLLVGLARELKRRLEVPVVCTLSGEDIFLEKLPEPYYTQARAALRERAAELAALIAMNGYYADFMADYLPVPRERIHVVPAGLNLEGHAAPDSPRCPADVPTIGYFARVCHDKGLHLLVEALKLLADDSSLPPVCVEAAGYLDPADRPYLDAVQRRAAELGLADRFRYVGEPDRSGKIAFLQRLWVMCLPAVYRESKGLSVLEAWANAVPTVLPAHGAFPEMVEATGGGLLYEPGDVSALAAALRRMLTEPDLAAAQGRQAQHAIHRNHHAAAMAAQMVEVYGRLSVEN